MYKTIMLAYDGSESGQQAILACEELTQWSHSKLWVVAVKPDALNASIMVGVAPSIDVELADTSTYEELLNRGITSLASDGYAAEGRLFVGDPVNEIANFAKQVEADLIVVGHTHRNTWVRRWWANSISGSLVEHAPCSVLCVIKKQSA